MTVAISALPAAQVVGMASVASGAGNALNLKGSAAFAASGAAGGNVIVTPGAGDGAGANGVFVVQNPDGNTAHQVQIYHDGTNVNLQNSANAKPSVYFGNGMTVLNTTTGVTTCQLAYNSGLILSSNLTIQWSDNTSGLGSQSTGLARQAAAIIAATNGSTGQGQFAGLGMVQLARSTDVAPVALTFIGSHAYAQATVNPTGGNVVVTPGCGRRFLTVTNFGSIAGAATVTVTVNGTSTVLTGGGTNWSSITSNAATATSIAAAINASAASPGVTATAVAAVVYVATNTGYSATLATSDATNLATTIGADGNVNFLQTNGSTLNARVNTAGIQNTPGEASLSSAFTKANATLGATNLSLTVVAGESYRITGILQVSNTTAAEGIQIAFDGGTATATTFFMAAQAVGTVVAGTVVSTTLAGVINYTTITGTDYIVLTGFLKVNAGGTLILRAAENTTSTGTLTVAAGSWVALNDTVAL